MSIFKSNNPIGTGHVNGEMRLPENLFLLKLSDTYISLFIKMVRTARDQRYGESFGKIEGTNAEWLKVKKEKPITSSELYLAVQILKHSGLLEERSDGYYVANYDIWVNGTGAEKRAYVDEIAKQVGYWGD